MEETTNYFNVLIAHLDRDESAASEKYLTLHLKLTKIFAWKGCPDYDTENLADKTLDIVGRKIRENDVSGASRPIENVAGYALEVARYVWLEYYRRQLKKRADEDAAPVAAAPPDESMFDEPDARMRCLRKCIAEKISNETDKQLILQYYGDQSDEKAKIVRKALAAKLGITTINLKVKACRLRERLEKCIGGCVGKLTVTEMPESDTVYRGGAPK